MSTPTTLRERAAQALAGERAATEAAHAEHRQEAHEWARRSLQRLCADILDMAAPDDIAMHYHGDPPAAEYSGLLATCTIDGITFAAVDANRYDYGDRPYLAILHPCDRCDDEGDVLVRIDRLSDVAAYLENTEERLCPTCRAADAPDHPMAPTTLQDDTERSLCLHPLPDLDTQRASLHCRNCGALVTTDEAVRILIEHLQA